MENWGFFERNKSLMEDLSTRTLAVIPTEYGRLFYLASLRDLASGLYSHAGLEALYSQGAVQEALTQAHQEICARIMEMPLARQEKDLLSSMRNFDAPFEDVLAHWRDLKNCLTVLPSGLPSYIKTLFCSNFETLLSIFEDDLAMSQQAA